MHSMQTEEEFDIWDPPWNEKIITTFITNWNQITFFIIINKCNPRREEIILIKSTTQIKKIKEKYTNSNIKFGVIPLCNTIVNTQT